MEKKVKTLLWVIIGIAAAVLIASIILAFCAPAHLITLWAGLFVGSGTFMIWKKYDTLEKHVAEEFDCDCEMPSEVEKSFSEAIVDVAVDKAEPEDKKPEDIDIKPEEKKAANPAPKKKRNAAKKKK